MKYNRKNYVKVLLLSLLLLIGFSGITKNQPRADSLILVYQQNSFSGGELMELLKSIAIAETKPAIILAYSQKLINEASKVDDAYYLCSGYLTKGVAYTYFGQIDKALEALFQGAEIAKANNINERLGDFYGQISNVYSMNNDIKNSLIYQKMGLRAFQEQNVNPTSIAFSTLNIAYDYYTIGEYDSATTYNQLARSLLEESNHTLGLAYITGNQALVKWKLGQLEAAKDDLILAIEQLKPLKDKYGMADYLNKLGSIYYEMGETDLAIEATREGLQMAKAVDLKESSRDALLLLSKIFEKQNNISEAYQAHKEYVALKDSIQNNETTQKMADLRTAFEVGQKQNEVDLLDTQKRAQEQLLLGLAVIILLLILGAFLIYRSYKIQSTLSLKLSYQKLELEKLNTSKNKLFSILSHDLRGPIAAFAGVSNMIKIAVRNNKTEVLANIADEVKISSVKLTSMLENLLSWAFKEQGDFETNPEILEVKSIVDELSGMYGGIAHTKSIEFLTDIAENSQIYADYNATMTVFRNLINNALKFTSEGGTISINSTQNEGSTIITISDTGVGIPNEKLQNLFTFEARKSTFGTSGEKGLGLGLSLAHDFVKANNGKISVDSTLGKGTSFQVSLPSLP